MFFRTYSVRMTVALDFDVTFIGHFDQGMATSTMLTLGIIL